FWQTARTCSSVACACMTTNMIFPRNLKFIATSAVRANASLWYRRCSQRLPVLASYTPILPRSLSRTQDTLNSPPPKRSPRLTSRRIGIHTSIAGGVENAAERAYRLGCNTFQIFSTSPRQWRPYDLSRNQCAIMNRLRQRYDLKPLAIHTNYLINLASTTPVFLEKAVSALRGEVERALELCAEYIVLHPRSFRGASREEGIARVADSLTAAIQRLHI